MVTEIRKSEKSMNIEHFIDELLITAGASIAGVGGSLAVILTFLGGFAEWVAILGGSIALIGGLLGVYGKVQEIRLKQIQFTEYQKGIERDERLFEEARQAGERDKIRKEVLNEVQH